MLLPFRAFVRRAYKIKLVRGGYLFLLGARDLLVYAASFLVPRSRRKWVFGSYPHFQDNSKYLYLHVVEYHKDIRAIWICRSADELSYFRDRGLPAACRNSWAGYFHCLTARVYFYSFYPADINFFTSGGAVLVNLWHGIGLKKIEFNDRTSPRSGKYHEKGLLKYLRYPWLFRRPDFVLSTSRHVSEFFFTGAFRVPRSRCLEFGYPRCDVFFWDRARLADFAVRFGTPSAAALLRSVAAYRRTAIYLPTFRDDGTGVLDAGGFDLEKMDRTLGGHGCLLLIKLHMNDRLPGSARGGFKNIVLLESDTDIYPLLPFTDVLVTDYSSIYYDYLLMEGKGVVLYPFDLRRYESECRELHFPYAEAMQGRRVSSVEQLCDAIVGVEAPDGASPAMRSRYWDEYHGGASGRIVGFIRRRLGLDAGPGGREA